MRGRNMKKSNGMKNRTNMKIFNFFVMFIFTPMVWAVEPVDEQQALLYYQIPFGGVRNIDSVHKFGFRIDRVIINKTTEQYRNAISLNDIMQKTASLDFQMNHAGIVALKMHGYNYLPHLVHRVDEETESGSVNESETRDPEISDKKEPTKFFDMINQTNFGISLGIGIGLFAVTGLGE